MKCRFCNRPLRNRLSTRRGYGPDCGKKNKSRIEFDAAEDAGQLNLVRIAELKEKIVEAARDLDWCGNGNGSFCVSDKKSSKVMRLIIELDREEGR